MLGPDLLLNVCPILCYQIYHWTYSTTVLWAAQAIGVRSKPTVWICLSLGVHKATAAWKAICYYTWPYAWAVMLKNNRHSSCKSWSSISSRCCRSMIGASTSWRQRPCGGCGRQHEVRNARPHWWGRREIGTATVMAGRAGGWAPCKCTRWALSHQICLGVVCWDTGAAYLHWVQAAVYH